MKYNELSHIKSVSDVKSFLNYFHTERKSILFEGGEGADFIYRITFPDNSMFDNFPIREFRNGKSMTKMLFELENNYNAKITFEKIQSPILRDNMIMTETGLPLLVAELLLISYRLERNSIVDCIDTIIEKNPLGWDDFSRIRFYYEYKVKNLLQDCALGVLSSCKISSGSSLNSDGIIVKENEEEVRYYIYDFDWLRKVWFETAYFEHAFTNEESSLVSTARNSGLFDCVYEEGGCFYMKINLKIKIKR